MSRNISFIPFASSFLLNPIPSVTAYEKRTLLDSSGGVAAKRSTLFWSLYSLPTIRHLISGFSSSPLFTSTQPTFIGCLPVSSMHIDRGTFSYTFILWTYSISSALAFLTNSASSFRPVFASYVTTHSGFTTMLICFM